MADRIRTILKHCRQPGSGLTFFRADGTVGVIRDRRFAAPEELFQLIAAFDAMPPEQLLKNSGSVRAGVIDGCFVKCYRKRSLAGSLKQVLLLPRPYRCLGAELRLREIGVATPEVLGTLRRRDYVFLPQMDYLVTAALPPNARSLKDQVPDSPHPVDLVLLSGMVHLAAKLHDAGVAHGDLSLRNIYALENQGLLTEFGVIDLDSAEAEDAPLPVNYRRRELARLISSYQDLRSYFKKPMAELPELIEQAAALYEAATGLDLRSPALTDRVNYLYRRKLRSIPR